jgi:hypothetical protein
MERENYIGLDNFDVRSSKIFGMPVGGQYKTGSSNAFREVVNLRFNLFKAQQFAFPPRFAGISLTSIGRF